MRAELLEMVGGDLDVLREIVDLFLEDAPVRRAALREALAAGDLNATYRAAHTLKGSAGNFGVAAITEAAVTVERHAREGDLAAARAASAVLEAHIDLLVNELRAL
jgi:HPt (histidine-containing phosphotransfer) domain-containing protein